MIEGAPLLGAKLLPPGPGAHHLSRRRLLDRLESGMKGRATVVAAGPGYGKTSLVSEFLHRRGGDLVYYRLDASDRDPWVFFRYLVQGIREHVPEFGERALGLWADSGGGSIEVERLADVFIRDAEESLGGEMIVVLDELPWLAEQDEIFDGALQTAWDRLLSRRPVLLLLLGGGVVLGAVRLTNRPPTIPTAEVRRGEFVESLHLRGEVKALRTLAISQQAEYAGRNRGRIGRCVY